MNSRVDGAYHEQNHSHQHRQSVDGFDDNRLFELERVVVLPDWLLGVGRLFSTRDFQWF